MLLVVLVPFLGFLTGVVLLWGSGFSWVHPGLGEGWHNNHHAFPTSARHGLKWWQLDPSYLSIRGLALMKLARKVRLPGSEAVQRRLVRCTP